jgi:hypothetical protein
MGPGFGSMKIALYRGRGDKSLRMAVEEQAGLPDHVDRKDWIMMAEDEITLEERLLAEDEDTLQDVSDRGFSFYKRVYWPVRRG